MIKQSQLYQFAQRECPVYEHVKRGTTYLHMGLAEVQAAAPVKEGDILVVYVGGDGKLWVRPQTEFEDGRFRPVLVPQGEMQ